LSEKHSLYYSLRHKLNGCPFETYFNSGVLVMNLNKIRQGLDGSLFDLAVKWLTRHGHSSGLVDQDALNGIFRGRVKFIDNKFNYFANNSKLNNDNIPECIVHYAGDKPWRVLLNSKIYMLYWQNFLKSEWMSKCDESEAENKYARADVENLIEMLSGIASTQPKLHSHTKQCWSHIWERLKVDVLQANRLKIILILIQEFIAKIKYKEDLRIWK
ncbi:MAG: hypothetical protein IJ576_03150, partial [Synergistaceae bacterium]|nr:hypothetical protein [Synergistaceae bacterium]